MHDTQEYINNKQCRASRIRINRAEGQDVLTPRQVDRLARFDNQADARDVITDSTAI